MSQPIVYVDTSEVREGALGELKEGVKRLARFIEANEPQLIAYNVYFSDDGTQMTVIHVHADSASLEYHMDVGGPEFRKLKDLVNLTSIRVYGQPSDRALKQLHEKAELLGSGKVVVQGLHAGFTRTGAG